MSNPQKFNQDAITIRRTQHHSKSRLIELHELDFTVPNSKTLSPNNKATATVKPSVYVGT